MVHDIIFCQSTQTQKVKSLCQDAVLLTGSYVVFYVLFDPFTPVMDSSDHVCVGGRQSTGTSVSSSSPSEQTGRIRPSVFVWGNIKEAPALWWGQQRPATFQLRPKGWSANFRSLSGIMT